MPRRFSFRGRLRFLLRLNRCVSEVLVRLGARPNSQADGDTMATRETMFRGSLAAAEASRDRRAYSGFISGLFEGIVRRRLFADASVPTMSGAATEFLATLRLLLTDKVDPEVIDRTGEIGEDVLAAFKQIGAFGIKIPRRYGGLGLSQSEYHAVATLLGSHDAATTVLLSAHNSIGVAEPVKLVGSQEQRQR